MNQNIGIGLMIGWLGLSSTALAAPPQIDPAERAQGVARFLLDHDGGSGQSRFIHDMTRDPGLACLMPQVAARLDAQDVRWFVKSLSNLDEVLAEEMGLLPAKAFMMALTQGGGFAVASPEEGDELLDALRLMTVDFEGRTLPLDQQATRGSNTQRDLVNGMYFAGPRLSSSLQRIAEATASITSQQVCSSAKSDQTAIRTAVDRIVESTQSIAAILDLLRSYADDLHPNDEAIAQYCQGHAGQALCSGGAPQRAANVAALLERRRPLLEQGGLGSRWDPSIATLRGLANRWSAYQPGFYESGSSYNAAPVVMSTPTNTQRAMQAVSVLRLSDAAEAQRIGPYLMFLAEFSDASSADESQEVLAAYLTPHVGSVAQREQPQAQLLIASYVGIQGGWGVKGSQGQWGLFAPVGLEWRWGMPGYGAIALTLAPFDLGHPISANLNGASDNLTLASVVAPSAMLSWGFAGSPLSLGLGVQRGTTFDGTGQRETRGFVMLGWDVPLLRLY